jgi:hypothetical protein
MHISTGTLKTFHIGALILIGPVAAIALMFAFG